ncbi:MAG: hypothetical protein MUO76_24145 [Anaerolineaceae bacterium]|nr:hypothetical protein [Anaerolineaceae bacterium]
MQAYACSIQIQVSHVTEAPSILLASPQTEATIGRIPNCDSDRHPPGISVVGAVCPESGESVGLLSPAINSDVVNIFLKQFTEEVSRDVHVLLLWDQAGFHTSRKLKIPENMTIVPFNLKFNKKLTNLHGRVNVVIRQGDQVYQIKTIAIRSFVINPDTNEAIFVSKANLIDITDPDNPVSIAGNLVVRH